MGQNRGGILVQTNQTQALTCACKGLWEGCTSHPNLRGVFLLACSCPSRAEVLQPEIQAPRSAATRPSLWQKKYTRHSCFEIFSPCALFFLAEINYTSDLKVLCQCHVHHCWWAVRGNMGYLNWESPLGRSGFSNQGAGEEERIILPCEDQHLSALCDRKKQETANPGTACLFSRCSKKILER